MDARDYDQYVEDAIYQAWMLCRAFQDGALWDTDGPIAVGAAIKAAYAAITPVQMALVLKHQGNTGYPVFPYLSAEELCAVLEAPGLFPTIAEGELRTALERAGYPQEQIDTWARKTHPSEHFNNTLRQRVSRLVREALSFSKKLTKHIEAIKRGGW